MNGKFKLWRVYGNENVIYDLYVDFKRTHIYGVMQFFIKPLTFDRHAVLIVYLVLLLKCLLLCRKSKKTNGKTT